MPTSFGLVGGNNLRLGNCKNNNKNSIQVNHCEQMSTYPLVLFKNIVLIWVCCHLLPKWFCQSWVFHTMLHDFLSILTKTTMTNIDCLEQLWQYRLQTITLLNLLGLFIGPWNNISWFCGPTNKVVIVSYCSYTYGGTWREIGVIFSTIFIGSTVHPRTIHHSYLVNFFPLSKFLPMKIRRWRPMSYAKYRNQTTIWMSNVMTTHNHIITFL